MHETTLKLLANEGSLVGIGDYAKHMFVSCCMNRCFNILWGTSLLK